MFLLDKIMPNGAACQYHQVVNIRIADDGIHAVVNSYHLPEMHMISWQDTYLLPPPFSAETKADVEALLVLPGAPFDGGDVVPEEEATLEQAQARKWAAVKAKRHSREQYGTAPTPFGAVQCDDSSKIKIGGLVQRAQIEISAGASFGVNFTLADDSTTTLDAAGMIQLGVAVAQHVQAIHDRAQALRAAIYAAETIADVGEIDIEEGWP